MEKQLASDIARLFFVLSLFFAIGPQVRAQTINWTKYDNGIPTTADSGQASTNGKVPIGSTGRGDDVYVFNPSVIKDGATYKMWYTGYDSPTYRIYYVTSSNGLDWTKLDNGIPANSDGTSTNGKIPLGTGGKGDSAHAYSPSVIKDGSTYKMWYTGADTTSRIYYATSSNGLEWTKYDNGVPVISDGTSTNGKVPPGSNGRGDDADVRWLYVLKDDAPPIYKMWYTGYDGTFYRIYYATSSNGLEWTKYDNTIPANSDGISTNGRIPLGSNGKGDDANVSAPIVIKDGGTYKMWYAGSDSVTTCVYHATSPDGLTWTKYDNTSAPVSDTTNSNSQLGVGTVNKGDDASVSPGFVLKDGYTYKMWYNGYDNPNYRVYYAYRPPPPAGTIFTLK